MVDPEDKIERLDAQIAQLKDRRADVRRKLAADERKARNHACMVLGGMVLSCFDEGWRTVDFGAVDQIVKKNSKVFGSRTAPELPAPEASKRLRLWERTKRWDDCVEKS